MAWKQPDYEEWTGSDKQIKEANEEFADSEDKKADDEQE